MIIFIVAGILTSIAIGMVCRGLYDSWNDMCTIYPVESVKVIHGKERTIVSYDVADVPTKQAMKCLQQVQLDMPLSAEELFDDVELEFRKLEQDVFNRENRYTLQFHEWKNDPKRQYFSST